MSDSDIRGLYDLSRMSLPLMRATGSKEIRGPVATPAGHVLLPTHREVMAAAFGLPLLGSLPPEGIAPAPVR